VLRFRDTLAVKTERKTQKMKDFAKNKLHSSGRLSLIVLVGLALSLAFFASRVALAQTRKAAETIRTSQDLSTAPLPGKSYGMTTNAQPQPLISVDVPSTCAAWQYTNPLTPSVYGAAATSNGTYAYVAGGYSFETLTDLNVFRRFDPVANAWTVLAPMPDAQATMGSAVYSPVNNKVYVFGGESAVPSVVSNATRIYDIASDTWSAGANMPQVRHFMASGYYNGKIYLVAGYNTRNASGAQAQVWEYDPVANTFNTTRIPIPHAVGGPGFGIINGHLYVAGGRDATNTVIALVYDYDIVANTWTARASLPAANNVPGSGVVNGQLWLFGGGNPFTFAPTTNGSAFYDPASDTWSAGPSLNVARSFIGGTAIGTTLFAASGFHDFTSVSNTETSGCAPVAQSAFSRKVHAGAGTFDVPLPLSGNVGVECRSGGATNDYQMIVNFASTVTVESVAVTSGNGSVSGFSVSGPQVTVNLTGVTNVQRITVTLHNVNDGRSTGDVPVSMGVLVGDVNGNAIVNASDVSLTKSQVGQAVSGSNFREDVNADGVINSTDVALVKAEVGTALPP
jgi:hypothetical protein